MSEFSLMHQGGLIMWPMLFLSLFGFIIFMERTLFLHKGQIRTNDFLAGIKNLLRRHRLIEALTLCEETPGPVPGIVKAALLHYSEGEERMRAAIESAAIVEIPALERRVGTIGAFVRVAPMLGMLGTVLGLLTTFKELQAEGAYAHLGVLSAGLTQALICTAVGLAIAIMAHLGHHFLLGRVRALVNDMEYAGHDLMQFLLRELPLEETHSGAPEQTP